MSSTFTLAWELDNGRRVVTDPIPHDADEVTVNVAVADATRKDKWRDMLQKLTDARRALSDAKQEATIARTTEANLYRKETELLGALNKAHTITCRARGLRRVRAKAVRQAEAEIRQIKNVLGGVAYGHHTDIVAGAVTKAAEVAEVAKVKAVDALNEVLALKASLADMDADVAADIARWANNN